MPPPVEDLFYQGTQLIMLKGEANIYRHLPDEAAKKEFIEEFWLRRDPNPSTAENEVREEYEARLEYVERWFREKVSSGHGWESDRGKIYLLLGAPEERTTRLENIIDRFGRPMKVLKERWVYSIYRLVLEFADADGFGVYRVAEWSPELLTAIKQAQFTTTPDEHGQSFGFKGKFKNGEIKINIPIKGITFKTNGAKMEIRFNITVYIYRNFKRIDTLTATRTIEGEKGDFLTQKKISLTLPYSPPASGRYAFDIIVEDIFAKSRYREMLEYDQY